MSSGGGGVASRALMVFGLVLALYPWTNLLFQIVAIFPGRKTPLEVMDSSSIYKAMFNVDNLIHG